MPAHKGCVPWNKGLKGLYKHSQETRKKISLSNIGKRGGMSGKKHSESTRKLMSEAKRRSPVKSCLGKFGEKHPTWIKDRSKLKKSQKRNDSAYYEWRNGVWIRDKYVCKLVGDDCCGKIVAHHIFGWSEFPNLRYELSNGITLCRYHHPKSRGDERRLTPILKSLVLS